MATKKTSGEAQALPSYLSAGLEVIEQAIEMQESNRKRDFTPEFFMKAGEDPVIIQIVDALPISATTHSVKRISSKGKAFWMRKTCMGDGCLYCARIEKDSSIGRPVFTPHLTVLDSRPTSVGNRDNPVIIYWERKLYRLTATRIQSLVQQRAVRKHMKENDGLTGALINVTRVGSGQSTAYSFEYMPIDELLGDVEFAGLLAQGTGWDPTSQQFAPCGSLSDGESVTPLDYEELLRPDTIEGAAAFLQASQTVSNDEEPITPSSDDTEDAGEFGSMIC